MQVIKRPDNSKNAEMRRIRGDSQSGLAANAPIRSALSLVFLPSLSELFGGCLTCDAKRRTCIGQAPAKEPFEIFREISRW